MPAAVSDSPALTLTTSEPLARALRRDYALAQKRAGHAVWEVPPIHSLQRWCSEQWLQTWPSQQLLHPVQELALWQRAIDDDGAASGVLSQSALAREARAMGRLIVQYGIDPQRVPRHTDEHHAFARWQRSVRRRMQDEDWTLECELPAHVARLLHDGEIPVPAQLTLAGARHALTPLENQLLQALEQTGSKIQAPPAGERRCVIERTVFADDEQQFRGLAHALKACLPADRDTDEPPPTILLACPDPQARRERIEAALRPLLAPWTLLPGEGQRPLPWRFAAGRGLDTQPGIAVALAICGLAEDANSLDELSRLLLASALWTTSQLALCARADHTLRDLGGTRYPLRLLARHVPEPLGMRFQKLLDSLREEPRRALPSQWVACFNRRLELLGWPGERPLVSTEFQAREQWLLSLARFSAMDRQLGPLAHGAALGWLREIVSSRKFEPRADHDQPILVLTPTEAAGLPADHIFFIDATDGALPGAVRRYPLLATEALRDAGVPDAGADGVLDAARRLAGQLQHQCSRLWLSHSSLDERGAYCLPTRLFGDGPPQPATPVTTTTAAERAATRPLLAWPAEDPVPPVRDAKAEGVFGGTRIFKDYVEAPFFAFCKYRLGIAPLPQAPAGIPPRAQGLILHALLEQAWRALRTSQALAAHSPEQLGALLDAPLDDALKEQLPSERFGPMLRAMERARLRDLALQWLAHERRRGEAFEVVECEQCIDLEFAGLSLRLVIDRLDRVSTRLGDERYLIIDYKTGREAETRGWQSDRMTEPQLPLYATAAALGELGISAIDGIAFAHLKDGHPALASAISWGLGLIDDQPGFRMDNWPAQLEAWRASLTTIAQGFLAGEAGLDDPRRYRYSVNRGLLDLVREQP